MSESQKTRKFLKHSTIYAAGNILRQLVSFVMLPIYTRFLSPADYGAVALISFALGILETLFGAKMVQAIPKFYAERETEKEKNAVVSSALFVTGIISSITILMIYFARGITSEILFDSRQYETIVAMCGAQILTQSLEYYALMYIRIKERPMLFVAISIAKLFLQLSLNIWFIVYLKLGVMGVAASGLTASAICGISLTIWTLANTGFGIDRKTVVDMIKFSWPLWLSGLAAIYIGSSNRYFIRIFDSLDSVGIFELATKFSGILYLLILTPVSQHWQTEQFKIIKEKNYEATLNSIFQFAGCVMLIGGLGVSIFSTIVIRIMAAPAFHDAWKPVPFLIFGAILSGLVDFSSTRFYAEGKTMWITKSTYVMAIVATIFYITLTPAFGAIGAAAALAVAQAIQLFQIMWGNKIQHRVSISIAPFVIMSVAAAAAYYLSNYLLASQNLWIDLPQKIVVYLVASAIIIAILCRDEKSKSQLVSFISQLRGKAKL